jgi:hypothetical protein
MSDVEALEEERDYLRRENRAVQEMLAQVLKTVGEKVVVTKESMGSLKDGTQIVIDEDLENEAFVFYVKEPTE